MITLLEGTPGSGKSYHGVSEYLLPWVRAGRRLYVAVDGFYLDRLAVFEGVALEDLKRQVTVWNVSDSIPSLLPSVEPGSAVCLDEAQTIFRAKEKVAPEVLRWLETHRHYGVDLLLMAQDFRQMTSGVTRLVEVTIKFRRMERFGLKKRYQGFVRGNPEETEVIRHLIGRYEPKVYAYYSSYATAGIREERKMKSIATSPLVLTGIVGLLVAVGFFAWGSWLKGAPTSSASALPPPVHTSELQTSHKAMELPAAGGTLIPTDKLRIQGGLRMDDKTYWVDDQGRILTADQIAGIVRVPVTESVMNGVPRLISSGVVWGGVPADNTIEAPIERHAMDAQLEESPLFQDEPPAPSVKCIGVDGMERDCDGSSSH